MSGHYRLWHDLFLWSQSRLLELHAVSSPQSLAVHRLGGGGGVDSAGGRSAKQLMDFGVRRSSEGFPGAHAGRNSGAQC